jgi:hypothetical protein
MADRTGRSAITAVVITAFESAVVRPAFKLPPVEGFRPRIHTKCYRQKDDFFQKTKSKKEAQRNYILTLL